MTQQPRGPREIIAGLLTDERFRTACAERDMGAVFRLLNHRGVSTRRIAALVEITQGRLYDYMNGKSRVEKLSIFEQIADALHIPGCMLGLARRPWEPEVHSPQAATPPSLGGDDLDAMDAFRDVDRQSGGGRLYNAVVRHLSDRIARRLVDTVSGPKAFAAAAAFTEMAGWMAHDSGLDDLAARHFTRALPLARMSGDSALTAGVAASNSHLALQTGDPAQAVHWAQAGLGIIGHGPRVPSVTARLHAMEARALAVSGQSVAASRALGLADDALGTSVEVERPWTSPFDAASLASESALVLQDMAKYDDAVEHAQRAVGLREGGRARSLALSRVTLASVHIRRSDLDAAVEVGIQLLTASPALSSVRMVNQLHELRRLLEVHRRYPPVRDFLARLDDNARTRSILLADIMQPHDEGTSR
ncbi:tetratricopeptide repeat protein [Streptomyces olivoreticuli]|uniref:tetratricopeptide repeat protein n=1 Tax=Streptomyces olivoreticuli TaxID=68246 RepID=UPI0026588E9A|nr:tetratricopeptide repeat protein [Streptomyces olivoreticuli]WKK21397.1 tetratricopeptide repeat protein [Streptomyces olivoreticuli]